jgi:NADPH-dependent ferric siderophore reductase
MPHRVEVPLARDSTLRQDGDTRPVARTRRAHVLRSEYVTPHMIRVIFGGPELAGLAVGAFADAYVKLIFPPVGASYSEPFDFDDVRRTLPSEQWPVMRSFTVRWWDAAAGELAIDFVYHGDEGIAGPWAAKARPSDEIQFRGPGGAYTPSKNADWHLLVGDESALPAIAAALERIPDGVSARAFISLETSSDEQVLKSPGKLQTQWVTRSESGDGILEAITQAELPPGQVQAFVHGEAGMVKQLRRYLRFTMQVSNESLSISGYWRAGRTDERWRAEKADWNREAEREEEQYAGGLTRPS